MTTDTVGGVWTYTLDLLKEFSSRDIQTRLVSLGRMPSAGQTAELEQIDGVQLVPTDYRLEWMDDPWSDVAQSGRLLLELERDFQPDIVHLNGYAHAALPFHAPKLVVAHSCVLSWWRAVYSRPAPAAGWETYRSQVQAGLSAADLLVAPTRAMLSMLNAEYTLDCSMQVIYNGSACDDTMVHGHHKQRIVFSAGRIWDEAKNISKLQEAAFEITAPVYIAGEQSNNCKSGAKASTTNIMLGYLTHLEVRDWLRRAAIYCLPALYEPFGLSILEAAQAGCAIVLGDVPTLRELWNDDCALFVNPRDSNAIAQAVNRLLDDDALRAHLQQNAKKRSASFQCDAMAESYITAYDNLAQRSAGA